MPTPPTRWLNLHVVVWKSFLIPRENESTDRTLFIRQMDGKTILEIGLAGHSVLQFDRSLNGTKVPLFTNP